MDLTNKQVLHKSFGKGNIVDCDDSYMVIHFSSGNKKFVYPDAFGEYLKLLDKKAAESIGKILQVQEVERKIEAEKIEKEKDKEFEEQLHTVRMEKLIKSHKIHLSSQVAFNCNNEELDGIFTEWNVFTGTIQSGANEGKPKKLIRIHQNSACLLTAKDAGMTEKDRYIAGVYMVDENFIGRLCEDGYIPAHSVYRIKLNEQESKEMLFWKYCINNKYPDNMTWNSGSYRYFDNIWMAQVLKDIASLRRWEQESKLMDEFLNYFCRLNHIEEKNIPKPGGPLVRMSGA